MSKQMKEPEAPTLPFMGKSRWRTIEPFIPVGRTSFLQLSKEGKAPPIERISLRCSFYDNREVHRWLADPVNYKAPGFENKGGR